MLPWQQHGRCHSVSLVMYISGAKFEERCSTISRDILDSVFYCSTGTIYDVITLLICIMQKRKYLVLILTRSKLTNLIANLFNNYFYSVYKPPCRASVYDELLPSNQLNLHHQHISQVPLSPGEVLDVLNHLDVNKATGPDKIPAKLLKNCAPCISNSLCAIFNKCLHLGKLPAAWKVANIIPISKSGLPGEVSNYRPISLLPIVSKVMERNVYNRLIEHISSQLYNLQHGFLKGKSTTSQLLEVLNEIGGMLDNRVQVDTIYLDFAKAFDRVDHHLLLRKLHLFGINGSLFCWLSDYLSNRFQQVTVQAKHQTFSRLFLGCRKGPF